MEPFILHGVLNKNIINHFLSYIDNLDWDDYVERQKKSFTHRQTKTIPIIFDKSFNFQHFNPHYTENYNLFQEQISVIEKIIDESVGEKGKIFRAILVLLPSKKLIPPHIDIVGKSLEIGKRCHVAIQTNEDCLFTVGDETKHLSVGEIWEIDNCGQEHSVSNLGETDRIHLIIDWVSESFLLSHKI